MMQNMGSYTDISEPVVFKESRFPAPKKRKAAALDGIDYKTGQQSRLTT